MKAKLGDMILVVNGKQLSLLDIFEDFFHELCSSKDGDTLIDILMNQEKDDIIDIKIKRRNKK